MRYCPNCGTKLTSKGLFCPECGTKLPSLLTEPSVTAIPKSAVSFESKSILNNDGFAISNSAAKSKSLNLAIQSRFTGVMKGVVACDFHEEDFDVILCAIQGMEDFLLEMKSRYGNDPYKLLIDELNDDCDHWAEYLERYFSDGTYPYAIQGFMKNCHTFFCNTVHSLENKDRICFADNITTLNVYIRVINIIQQAAYSRRFLYEAFQPPTPAPTPQQPPVKPAQPQPANKPVQKPKEEQHIGDALDFKDRIQALEKELGENKPEFKVSEFSPSLNYAAELDKLVGLDSLKTQIGKFIDNFRLQLIRQQEHPELKIDTSYNCIFKGKPGTGKTTVARLIAGLLRQQGIVKSGRLVEVDAASLVSGWIGFSAKIATLAAMKAIDGVLFIDEAYAIMNNFQSSKGSGPGKDVIDALTPVMENNRNRLLVIIAGYDEEMDAFLNASNTGFPSRFKTVMQFEDYNPAEMTEIFLGMVKHDFYKIGEDELRRIHYLFQYIYKAIPQLPTFANARTVRNVFDQVKQRASQRMLNNPDCDHDLLTVDDVTLSEKEIKAAIGQF